MCNVESFATVTAECCSSDAVRLQDTPTRSSGDLPSADQDSAPTLLPNGCSHPPAVVKKRGRGRPPIYNLSDKRKAQLKEVDIFVFLCNYIVYILALVCMKM